MAFFLLSSGSLSAVQVPTNFAEVIEVTGIASTAVEYPTYSVRMTGYNAVPEQTNADPLTTASGAYSHPEVVVARSRDLAEELPYGTIIEILAREENKRSCGFYTVEHLIGYRVVALLLLMTVSVIAMLFDIIPVLLSAVLSAAIWNFFFINFNCFRTYRNFSIFSYFIFFHN